MARVVTASSAGTAFEWYDFFIFGSLAPVISKVFFAGLDPTAALIAALGLFAAGFAFRPLGRDHLRRDGRPRRPQGDLPRHRQPDGRRDLRHRPAADLCDRRASSRRSCSSSCASARAPRWAANMAARRSMSPSMPPTTSAARRPAGSSPRPSFGLLAALAGHPRHPHRARRGGVPRLGLAHPVPRLDHPARRSRCGCALKLAESPAFAKLKEEGEVCQGAAARGLRASATASSASLIAFFGIMCAQGAVWYCTFFYMQVFLERSLGVPGADRGHAADRHDPGQRAALRLLRLAERPHRPQAGDARRDAARAGRSISPASS